MQLSRRRLGVSHATLWAALVLAGAPARADVLPLSHPARPPAPPVAAADPLVPFASPESEARLARSTAKVDFFPLANNFESQQNLAYCGPTSGTIVLNTLRADNKTITKPRDPTLFPAEYAKSLPPGLDPVFARYTQSMFFDAQTTTVKTRDQFFGKPKTPGDKPSPGLELREFAGILAAHGLGVTLRVADDKLADDTIRRELVANLRAPDDYAVVNYFRPALGQKGGGHISPLGAYDEASDSFLVLDVNPNGHTWVWVPTPLLIKAMRTRDAHENRGYVLVREGAPQ
jgi:Phytochelatin synthase